MIHKDYCSTCKTKEGPLGAVATSKTTTYYICRPCNNTRITRYSKTPKGRESFKKLNINMRKKHPEKFTARQKVYKAIKAGLITKPTQCNDCGDSGRIETHHSDYKKPLIIDWLCNYCHANMHNSVQLTHRIG